MAKWTTGTYKSNGVDIRCLQTGVGKPPLVLLHGLMTNGACWTPLARTWEKDYAVIMPDARGHGNSSAPKQGYAYSNLAADAASLIEALKLVAPVLIGHSMGGMTAAMVASQNPHLSRALVLVDPAFLTPQRQREVCESDVAARHLQILNRPKEDFLAEIQARHNRRSPEIIELLTQARFQTSIHAFEILNPPSPDYEQLISSLTIPSLLVIGDFGAVVSSEMAARLAELNRRLKIVQIAGAGHGIPYDQPERLSAVIKTFLRSLSV